MDWERVSLERAEETVRASVRLRGAGRLPLKACVGKVLSQDVTASMSQPPFRRSAMDGYEVRRRDCTWQAVSQAVPFKVVGEVDAGEMDAGEVDAGEMDTGEVDAGEMDVGKMDAGGRSVCEIRAGEAVRIMTGAKVPDSVDMVIPQELSDMGEEYVVFSAVPSWDNIAPVGEDFKAGDVIARKGQRVDAYLLACAAASGMTELNVYRSPCVPVIATGDELCFPGRPLKSGQIYDSGSVYLLARLEELHCHAPGAKHVADDPEIIAEELDRAVLEADMVITTGGVSVGKRDFLEQAVGRVGGEVLFHGIHVKPGMPTMFSLVRGVPVLSLSGNPYSAAAMFEWLFPFRRKIYGEGILAGSYGKRRPVPRVVRGCYEWGEVGLAESQGNGVMRSGIGANCLALLPAGKETMEAGSRVRVMMM